MEIQRYKLDTERQKDKHRDETELTKESVELKAQN